MSATLTDRPTIKLRWRREPHKARVWRETLMPAWLPQWAAKCSCNPYVFHDRSQTKAQAWATAHVRNYHLEVDR